MILGIIIFSLLIVAHEFGHFLVAKRNGVEVEEFGVGFPPKIFAKKMGKGILKSVYSINLLPIGGFVKLKGESDSSQEPGSFGSASLWSKTKIIMAGVVVNFVIAVVLFSVVAAIRLPVVVENQFTIAGDTELLVDEVVVAQVVEDSPADQAGLETGHTLININGEKIEDASELGEITKANAGKTIELVARDPDADSSESFNIQLLENPKENQGYLGVGPADREERRSTWSAPLVGAGITVQYSLLTLQELGRGLVNLVTPGPAPGGQEVVITGPVGIFSILGQLETIPEVLRFTAFISMSLGLMNALPIPALDGGRLFVTWLFRNVLRRPLSETTENAIHGSGMLVLLGVLAIVTVADIIRAFF